MSILVDDKPIEIVLRYVDKKYNGGAVGAIAFSNKEQEEKWVEKENKKRAEKSMELKALGKAVPEEMAKDALESIKELKTYWKRMDWGTQNQILTDSQRQTTTGEPSTDWTKFRLSQMNNLLIGWDLKTNGNVIPISDKILKRLDFNIAIALIQKYEELVADDEEEMENLE